MFSQEATTILTIFLGIGGGSGGVAAGKLGWCKTPHASKSSTYPGRWQEGKMLSTKLDSGYSLSLNLHPQWL